MTKKQDALDYHSRGRPGKMAVVPTKPLTNQRDLSLAYSPGVAEPCLEIKRDALWLTWTPARASLVPWARTGALGFASATAGRTAGKRAWREHGTRLKRCV